MNQNAHCENLNVQMAAVLQILPTLATNERLDAAVAKLATNERLDAAVAKLATNERLDAAVAKLATNERLDAAVAKLATKDELAAAVAKLATKDELAAAVAKLATKDELAAAVAKLATKDELREESERTRRESRMLYESLKDDIRIVAEGVVAVQHSVDSLSDFVRPMLADHEHRITQLEVEPRGGGRPRRTRSTMRGPR